MPVSIESLRLEAEAAHARYPQYRGHWDDHVLVIVNKRVVTKMGLAFEKGEMAMAEPGLSDDVLVGSPLRSVYSRRTQINTLMDPKDVESYPG